MAVAVVLLAGPSAAASAAQVDAEQIGGATASRATAASVQPPAPQISAPVRGLDAAAQARGTARAVVAPEQITASRRITAPPLVVSDPGGARDVSVEAVRGRDRCDPTHRTAGRAQCARSLEDNAKSSLHGPSPSLTAGTAVIQTPPGADTASDDTAAERLSTAAGADPVIAAEAAAN